jgi:hypothetical protein
MATVNGAAKGKAESVAADQTPAKDQTAQSAIARYALAITHPAGKNIDWMKVRAAGAVIAGLTAIHGLKHRRWQYVHTFGIALGVSAAALARLKDRYAGSAQPPQDK